MSLVESGPKSNMFKILCLISCKFDEDPIKMFAIVRTSFSHYMSLGDLRASNSYAKVQFAPTPKLSEILQLSSLPVSLMTIRLKVKSLSAGQILLSL